MSRRPGIKYQDTSGHDDQKPETEYQDTSGHDDQKPEAEAEPAALFPPEQAARDRAIEAARAAESTFLTMFFMGISSKILFGGR